MCRWGGITKCQWLGGWLLERKGKENRLVRVEPGIWNALEPVEIVEPVEYVEPGVEGSIRASFLSKALF